MGRAVDVCGSSAFGRWLNPSAGLMSAASFSQLCRPMPPRRIGSARLCPVKLIVASASANAAAAQRYERIVLPLAS